MMTEAPEPEPSRTVSPSESPLLLASCIELLTTPELVGICADKGAELPPPLELPDQALAGEAHFQGQAMQHSPKHDQRAEQHAATQLWPTVAPRGGAAASGTAPASLGSVAAPRLSPTPLTSQALRLSPTPEKLSFHSHVQASLRASEDLLAKCLQNDDADDIREPQGMSSLSLSSLN